MTNSADPDQKPTDLDLHCLLRQGMSCLAREGLTFTMLWAISQLYRLIWILANYCMYKGPFPVLQLMYGSFPNFKDCFVSLCRMVHF